MPDGQPGVYNVIQMPGAAWVIPVTSDGRIVLILHYRHTVEDWCWEVPAGGLKPGLTIQENALADSHVGPRVTFEHLLASFGLEGNVALLQLGRLVHFLDAGDAPVSEAQGFSAILAGARARLPNDKQLLAEASRMFDHLYRSYQEK